MIDISGYGLLRDNYSQEDEGSEWSNLPIDEWCQNLYKQNIKSQIIESSPDDNPIIDLKSISLQSNGPSRMIMLIYDEFCERIRNANRNGIDTDTENWIEDYINNMDTSKLDVLKAYNYMEDSIYPVQNYDLLDIQNLTDDKDIKFDVFYDKLILSTNDKMDVFKLNGPLYNTSPSNIGVLTKVDHINLTKIDVSIAMDTKSLDKLFKVLLYSTVSRKNDNGDYVITLVYSTAPHFRTVTTTYNPNPIDVYIPKLMIGLCITINIVKLRKRLLYQQIFNENASSNCSYLEFSPRIFMRKDFDFYAFKVFNCFSKLSTFDGQPIHHTTFNTKHINNLKFFATPYYGRWPFGNVHDSGKPCIKYTNVTYYPFKIKTISENGYVINLNNVMYGFYNDFMGSPFNRDLIDSEFMLKEDYLKYLDWKDSFNNKKDAFKLFTEELIKMRKEIVNYQNEH